MTTSLFMPSYTALPLDTIRRIVDYASLADRRTALQLVLVSRQVKEWADVNLYSTVELYLEPQIASFHQTVEKPFSNTKDFFAATVRSLSVSFNQGNGRVPRILLACPNIEDFTMYIIHGNASTERTGVVLNAISDLEYSLHTLRPMRVQTQLYHCFRNPLQKFYNTLFQNMTHLALLDDWEYWTRWSDDFCFLPALTHLCLDLRVGAKGLGQGDGWRVSDCVWRILKTCRSLRVCILRLLFDPYPDTTKNMLLRMMQEREEVDGRLVFMREANVFGNTIARSFQKGFLWSFGEKMAFEQQQKRLSQKDSLRRSQHPQRINPRMMERNITRDSRVD
ncbi:hypothetical protein K435DRAFT_960214 [Dendrothele bispora CBS 962.96]|uniref:F-box domain-containing protein n=1 Tax=Dendrothele bispora (strain CBS 962.96) TaxID=1314807 RepID=A0A4S8MUS8_DENBC|nr:hypothetical protein K435DRAFT_960214 [Dendrothele bispora CBS 962.96]